MGYDLQMKQAALPQYTSVLGSRCISWEGDSVCCRQLARLRVKRCRKPACLCTILPLPQSSLPSPRLVAEMPAAFRRRQTERAQPGTRILQSPFSWWHFLNTSLGEGGVADACFGNPYPRLHIMSSTPIYQSRRPHPCSI